MLKKVARKAPPSKEPTNAKDIDVIFTEIKPKIIEVVKETQEEIEVQKEPVPLPQVEAEEVPVETIEIPKAKPAAEVVENARTSYITYTYNKPKLNFDNFGRADESMTQDLTKINGIGPYIEQKLNEIGIYNYDQISRFQDEDIRVLTELIDFFPGRIERDDWVRQAEELNN
ncbi:MAG: hypothetical protein AAF466_13830 [Bacteroidota bacterium]